MAKTSLPVDFYEDKAPGIKVQGFTHWAYAFENEIVSRARKESKEGKTKFEFKDFENSYSGEYEYDGKVLTIIFDRNKQWEYRKVSDKEFKCDDQSLYFEL